MRGMLGALFPKALPRRSPAMVRRMPGRPVELDRDHARPRTAPTLGAEQVERRLAELVVPAAYAAWAGYHDWGLRTRLLTLPVMVGLTLGLIWRQLASVSEVMRVLGQEQLLWVPPQQISQQAFSARLQRLPAALFGQVWQALQPPLAARAAARQRPLPAALVEVSAHFAQIWAADSTKLEAVFKKVGARRGQPGRVSGGTVEALLDLVTKLPVQVWIDPNPHANDTGFAAQLLATLPERTLLVMDRGFRRFAFYDALTQAGHGFVTGVACNAAYETERLLRADATVRDRLIRLGRYRSSRCQSPLRLVAVRQGDRWQRYLTNVCDPAILSAEAVAAVSGQRWRIEEAFLQCKRLLGLSYLWSADAHAIALQVWATWLRYGVLVDLGDAVAEVLHVPLERISLEMVYRGLYHVAVAVQHGLASDPVDYLVAHRHRLGLSKRQRRPPPVSPAAGMEQA
jgi:hypothetical protein